MRVALVIYKAHSHGQDSVLHITKKSRYAVRALIGLSLRKDNGPVPLADLARSIDVPFQFLEQIFAQLRRSGIVTAKRGAKGGYMLAIDADDISVLSIIETLDGPINPAECTGESSCGRVSECSASFVWLETKKVMEDYLGRETIASLAAHGAGAASAQEDPRSGTGLSSDREATQ